jgi:hypothetical protein
MLKIFVAIAALGWICLSFTSASGQSRIAVCKAASKHAEILYATADCIPGCARGYEACKARCGQSDVPPMNWFAKLGLGMSSYTEVFPKSTVPIACVQPPNARSNSKDCLCSGSCAQLGEGGSLVCQSSCQ